MPARQNYSFLFSARWLRYIALALIAVTACVFLAMWQDSRRKERDQEIATIERNYNAAPVPLETVLAATSANLAPTDEWTKVTMHGRYDPSLAVLSRNRTVGAQPGYYAVVPLTLDSGRQILVSRGWLPTPSTGTPTPAEVVAAPAGPVTVTGWLRPTEDGLKDNNPPGLIRAIDTSRVPGLTDPYTGAYVQLEGDGTPDRGGLTPLPEPSTDPGSHLSYTLQWIAFGLMILTALVYATMKERKALESGRNEATDRGSQADNFVVVDKTAIAEGLDTSGSRYGTMRAATGRKVSSDEAIEDAQLDAAFHTDAVQASDTKSR